MIVCFDLKNRLRCYRFALDFYERDLLYSSSLYMKGEFKYVDF